METYDSFHRIFFPHWRGHMHFDFIHVNSFCSCISSLQNAFVSHSHTFHRVFFRKNKGFKHARLMRIIVSGVSFSVECDKARSARDVCGDACPLRDWGRKRIVAMFNSSHSFPSLFPPRLIFLITHKMSLAHEAKPLTKIKHFWPRRTKLKLYIHFWLYRRMWKIWRLIDLENDKDGVMTLNSP